MSLSAVVPPPPPPLAAVFNVLQGFLVTISCMKWFYYDSEFEYTHRGINTHTFTHNSHRFRALADRWLCVEMQ